MMTRMTCGDWEWEDLPLTLAGRVLGRLDRHEKQGALSAWAEDLFVAHLFAEESIP